jgi:hypothetical protein
MGIAFFDENEVLAINFGGTEIMGKYAGVSKDEATGISFLLLKKAVMILTQMTEKGLAHNMIDVSENGNFSEDIIVPDKNISFIRRVSPLGDLYRKYLEITSKIKLI